MTRASRILKKLHTRNTQAWMSFLLIITNPRMKNVSHLRMQSYILSYMRTDIRTKGSVEQGWHLNSCRGSCVRLHCEDGLNLPVFLPRGLKNGCLILCVLPPLPTVCPSLVKIASLCILGLLF